MLFILQLMCSLTSLNRSSLEKSVIFQSNGTFHFINFRPPAAEITYHVFKSRQHIGELRTLRNEEICVGSTTLLLSIIIKVDG